MQPTLDGSWAWVTTDPTSNPFGSFRQEGTFPESLFADSLGHCQPESSTAYLPRTYTDTISESNHNFDDSTHLYINTMDSSDEDNKTVQFGRESGHSKRSCEYCCDAASNVIMITSAKYVGSVGHIRRSVTSSKRMHRDNRTKSFVTAISAYKSGQSKRIKSSSALRTVINDPNTTLQSKVLPWLQSIPMPCSLRNDTLRHSLESSRSSSLASSTVSGRGQPSGASESETDFHLPNTRHSEISMDSDATFFMQHPMVNRGIKRKKVSTNKRQNIVKKMRHFGKLLSNNVGRSKINTLAVL